MKEPAIQDEFATVHVGHVIDVLAAMPAESVHMCVTSPPYWSLRNYRTTPAIWLGEGGEDCEHEWGEEIPQDTRHVWTPENSGDKQTAVQNGAGTPPSRGAFCRRCGAWKGELGLEPDPGLYVEHILEICRQIRRVLRPEGSFWLNLGDSYAASRSGPVGKTTLGGRREHRDAVANGRWEQRKNTRERFPELGIKPKDLCLIPHTVAMALRSEGWWLRSTLIFSKTNPMPASVRDRPTSAHEYVFLLTKRSTYYYDYVAVREPWADSRQGRDGAKVKSVRNRGGRSDGFTKPNDIDPSANGGRNMRDVWEISTVPSPDEHFAVFPAELPTRAIKAGSSEKGVCADCGAPWRRVVKKESVDRSNAARAGTVIVGKGHATDQVREDHDIRNGPSAVITTLGWEPTCDHNARVIPAVVLDPFAGSGTSLGGGQAAGRRSIGIELQPKYLKYIRRTLERSTYEPPLFELEQATEQVKARLAPPERFIQPDLLNLVISR